MIDSGNLWRTIISPAFLRRLGYAKTDLRPVPGLTKIGTAKKGANLVILGQLRHYLPLRFGAEGEVFKVQPVVVEGLTMDMNISGPFLKTHQIDQIHSADSLRIKGKLIKLISPRQESSRRRRATALLLDPNGEYAILPPLAISTIMTRMERGDQVQGAGMVAGSRSFDERYGVHTWVEALTDTETDGRVAVHILNAYHKEIKIPHGTEMGTIRPIRTSPTFQLPPEDGDLDRRVLVIDPRGVHGLSSSPVSDPEGAIAAQKWTTDEKKEWIRKEFRLDESPCLPTNDDKIQATLLLLKYFDVFSIDGEFGATDLIKHGIDTGDTAPIRLRNRPINPSLEEDLNKQLDKWLKHKVIEPAESPWNFALVAAPKKGNKIRWCVDFRRLNLATRKDAFPLPSIEDNLARLSRSKVFSAIDGCGAFHVIEVNKEDRPKTAFSTPRGQFQFVRMPFGLANAPASYSRLVQKVLQGIPLDIALPYLDDTAVHTSTLPKHYRALSKVLDAHRTAGLKLQPSKCQLFRDEIAYLGHLVSPQGIQTLPSHTKAIKEWPMPTTRPQARAFIGKVSYYRKYVPQFSALARPWTDIMNKVSAADDKLPLQVSEIMKHSFEALRKRLMSAPILAYPRFSSDQPFVLDTDWSGDHMAIGAVLSQEQDGKERVIAYGSKKLNGSQASYPANKGELFAIIYFLKHFRYYLLYRPFILRTDHHALKWIYTMDHPTSMIARWLETLANFDFQVKHRPGISHGNADALSRIDHGEEADPEGPEDETGGVSLFNLWTQRLWDGNELPKLQQEDSTLKVIRYLKISGKQLDPLVEKGMDEHYRTYKGLLKSLFIDENGILCKEGPEPNEEKDPLASRHSRRVCLPRELWDHVIGIQHEVGAHMGRDNTLDRVRSVVYFPNMKTEVADYLLGCPKCVQKMKKPQDQLHTMVAQNAAYPFQRISVDFVGPFPTSYTGNTYLLTVKDVFSKWVEAFPIPAQTAEIAANTLHREIFSRFGLPEVIHSDNGRQFVGRIWQTVGDRLGIKITHTPSYNPKSNPVERAHRDLNGMLKALSAGEPTLWEEHVPAALFALRTTVNASTKYAPYRLLFGRNPNTPLDLIFGEPPAPIAGPKKRGRPAKIPYHVSWANRLKDHIQKAFEYARINTEAAVLRRRRQYNQNRKDYIINALVWLFTPVDSSKDKVSCRKLANYWTGPWRINSKPNDVTVELLQVTLKNLPTIPKRTVVTSIDRLAPFKPGSPAQPMLPNLILAADMGGDEFAECIDIQESDFQAPYEVPQDLLLPVATSGGGPTYGNPTQIPDDDIQPSRPSLPLDYMPLGHAARKRERAPSLPNEEIGEEDFAPRTTSSPIPQKATKYLPNEEEEEVPGELPIGPGPSAHERSRSPLGYNLRNRDNDKRRLEQERKMELDRLLGPEDSMDATNERTMEEDEIPSPEQSDDEGAGSPDDDEG